MPEKKDIIAMKLNLRYKPDRSGVLVGKCKEFPFIIVKGDTLDSLTLQVMKHLEIYMNNFPEEAKRILSTYGKKVNEENLNIAQDQEQVEDKRDEKSGWQNVMVTVPTRR